MAHLNTESDISAFVQVVQEDVYFAIRDTAVMQNLVSVFGDMQGLAPRTSHSYAAGTVVTIGESDDLTSTAWTPTAGGTITPAEIGLQYFLTDSRIESEPLINLQTDAAKELGLAAADKIESDLLTDMASFTGGTIGAAGTAITWGYVMAAAAVLRSKIKNRNVPLNCVMHDYQWYVLGKSNSIAASSVQNSSDSLKNQAMKNWYVGTYAGIRFFTTSNLTIDTNTDAYAGMFVADALALDWRRKVRVKPERDESRRGLELNLSSVYAHGVWRPTQGVTMLFDAATPSS
jgi:hypothetical protein